MSLKKVEQVKGDRGFKIADIIIYVAIIVITVALFVVLALTRDKSPLKGTRIYLNNSAIFSYSFESDKYEIVDSDKIIILNNDSEQLVLRVVLGADGNDFNEVTISKKEVWVDVTATDCSTSSDCMYMDKIVDGGGWIYCAPHNVKVLPYNYTPDNGVIIQ
jgi:hypothetical protein